ncbi:MAG: ACT domain-containing protein [Ruminococcaceae bacterium]|nr:ACT domain-containing protein [Oscillospiraceae bacterium]
MEIEKTRQRIDEVNDKILELFLERMELSKEVIKYKIENNLPVVDKEREREILKKVKEKAGDKEEYAYQLFTKLMELSKAEQREFLLGTSKIKSVIENALLPAEVTFPKMATVACQGVEGANSQVACDKLLPRGDIMYVKTFEAVFDAVEAGFSEFGILPIENNTHGSVRKVYELLQKKNFYIVRSTTLNIRHELLVKPGTKLSDVKVITSHEQAIGQCSKFLSSLDKTIKIEPCSNTALAAKMVRESDGSLAAIAGPDCRELYGLEILKDDIQDSDNNYTKFILIAKKLSIYAGSNRISLILACPNKPGALGDILNMFSSHGVNMLKLESCPVTGRNFEFIFYIELDASVREKGVIPMLEELERTSESFTFLGNYPVV